MRVTNVMSPQFSNPVAGLGLVAEGGGQRGVFTAGVLDSWQVARFNPFEVLIGTSAGAQNIASYISGQTGYAYSLISNLTRTNSFFNPWRVFTKSNVMDLDWYFKQTEKTTYRFDENKANLNAHNRKVRFSASDASKLATELMNPMQDGWLNAMRASSAIPFLYKSNTLVDGGVTAPIPVNEAYHLGAKKMVVIRTNRDNQNPSPKIVKQLGSYICKENKCPSLFTMFKKHENSYLQAEQFIQSPPDDVVLFEIKPERELESKVLGSSQQAILSDYKHGFELGTRFIAKNARILH